MTVPSPYPEFPIPRPPGREPPPPIDPVPVPMVGVGSGLVRDGLAEQRTILVSGPLDRDAVTVLTAQLMAFDGSSSRDVEVVVSGPGGPVGDVLPVLDVIGLMRAKVNVTAIGSVAGTAVGLVAACTGERRAAPHAGFSLRIDGRHTVDGTAVDIARHADELAHLRARYLAALSAATGQGEEVLVDECDHGHRHTATEAIVLGIIDVIADRS